MTESSSSPSSSPSSPLGDIITLNIGGRVHKLLWSKLDKYPLTRLGQLGKQRFGSVDLSQVCDAFDLSKSEFFFDHDPGLAGAIVNYYRTGSLHVGNDVCPVYLKEELKYWQMLDDIEADIETSSLKLEMCCRIKFENREQSLADEMRRERVMIDEILKKEEEFDLPCPLLRRRLWYLFDKPNSSRMARFIYIVSLVFILVSTLSLVFSTEIKNPTASNVSNETLIYKFNINSSNSTNNTAKNKVFIIRLLSKSINTSK